MNTLIQGLTADLCKLTVLQASDLLAATFDDLFQEGRFQESDTLLQTLDPTSAVPVHLLVGLLVVTLPAKEKLPSRPQLVGKVEDLLLAKVQAGDSEWSEDRVHKLLLPLR